MQVSHSRISTFVKCPYQYKLRYVDKLKTIDDYDPASPLILGHALHTGIEKDVKAAIDEYYNAYPVITDAHINEAIKLEYWLPKIKELLPEGEHEIKIADEDFIGFIDLLVPVEQELKIITGTSKINGITVPTADLVPDYNLNYQFYDLYDFKYSNNVKNYMDSEQLHLYKYYFEKLNPTKRIRNMYFMFVPKSSLKLKYKNKTNKRDETIEELRKRTLEDLNNKQIEFVKIDYDPTKIIDFLTNTKHAVEAVDFPKNETRLCDWCEFQKFCQDGIDYDIL